MTASNNVDTSASGFLLKTKTLCKRSFGQMRSCSSCTRKQKPHRKNDGKWSRENPHEFIESNDRNDQKVMIFMAIVEGKIPLVHAFIDDRGGKISVNGDCCLKLLQDRVWPLFRSYATRRNLWWMQDGAPPHCTDVAKSFLEEKFRGRVISRGTEFVWPAHTAQISISSTFISGRQHKSKYICKSRSSLKSL